jgi:murein DD-endopeptidase MepM/ murein hydrolase activator NlpD
MIRLSIAGIGAIVILLGLVVWVNPSKVAAQSIILRPPYDGTYRLTSFFDHSYPNYGEDNQITIYTSEAVLDCSPHCYQGHSGYDWAMPQEGTPILAAADGIVEELTLSANGYGNSIILELSNGYYTLYGHLREPNPFNVIEGQQVRAGDLIGWSGNTGASSGPHLHFGVYRGLFTREGPFANSERYATDPFGWHGASPDPLLNYPTTGQGHTASCLWRSKDEDPVSCADIIVEDDAQGSTLSGTWIDEIWGNGYRLNYRYNTTGNDHAYWIPPPNPHGIYKVYAFVPPYYPLCQDRIGHSSPII